MTHSKQSISKHFKYILSGKILVLSGVFLFPLNHVSAQTPINVIPVHSGMGLSIMNDLQESFDLELLSQEEKIVSQGGKKASIYRMKFSERVSKREFQSAMDDIVAENSFYVNPSGGWTDENGGTTTFIIIEAGSTYRGGILVSYSESTRISALMIMSSKL